MLKEVNACMKPGGYTLQMLQRATNCQNPFELVAQIPHISEVESQNTVFHIYERAYQVLGEAQRV